MGIGDIMYIGIKRMLDLILSLAAAVVLSPIIAVIALLIKLTDGGCVFFKQKRVGKDKSHFYIYKFRTMRVDTPKDVPTHLLDNPERFITPVGRFLRKTSLDELPQLYNIIKGDMAVVGPRPALYNQYDLIALRDRCSANSVTPGLTGWAQINGRDELPLEVKARLDGEYVKRMSLGFDLLIILKTVVSVFKSDGVREGRK
jgi:O-antigen biosynthesis protein WbqP